MIKDIELRKLPADSLSFVEEVLETNEDWKRFMKHIPKNLENMGDEQYELKYNGEHIRLIEEYALQNKVKCAKVLFVEWGTSGRVRPTLMTLLTLLVKAEMFKAADAIAVMLGEPHPERPSYGPPAPIEINLTELLNTSVTQQMKTSTSDHGNDSTKKMNSVNLIKFPTDIDCLEQQSDQASASSASDMIEFSKSNVVTEYLPASDILNPKTITSMNKTGLSQTSASVVDSETQQSHYPTQGMSSQSANFREHTPNDILEDDALIQFAYRDLEAVTNNFTDTLIGSGGFGDVYLGIHDGLGSLAVKKVHEKLSLDMVSKMFNCEVRSLSLLRHENIVPIIGFSLDGPARCIVCEYIDGGSLKQKLVDKTLNKSQRLNIMIGTAEGLRYVHNTVKPNPNALTSSRKSYFFHGDVKSANILLTKDCLPKLCDFGLAKQFDTTYLSANVLGTRYYMAPESFNGTITQKSDVYSYGIVLLELLTGSEPVVNDGSAIMNIKDYLEENCIHNDITEFVDKVVGEWTEAQNIYGIAKLCLKFDKAYRPSMDEVCKELHKI